MSQSSITDPSFRERVTAVWQVTRRAFAEFLALPTGIIVGCLLLSVATYWLDQTRPEFLTPTRTFLEHHFFSRSSATGDFLGSIATSLITVTSITASVLLLAVQQAATTMTARVFDQYLRRRLNQIYFGLFVGLALYALLTQGTANKGFNPVFGGAVAFLLTAIALYLLIVLIYSTVDQMRPEVVVSAIHDHALEARDHERALLQRTRRPQVARADWVAAPARSGWHGYVTAIDLGRIGRAIQREANGDAEVHLRVILGSYVSFHDVVAEVRAGDQDRAQCIADETARALRLEGQRDVRTDPQYALTELEMIAWTSISTAKSSPEPGLITIRSLRDLLARWSAQDEFGETATRDALPIFYPARTMVRLLEVLESLGIVSSESLQHQSMAEVLRAFTVTFDRLPRELKDETADIILRLLSASGDHVLSRRLQGAFSELSEELKAHGYDHTAGRVDVVMAEMQSTIGRLVSRGDRAKVGREG